MNVVAMARHGPILKDNEATGSGKVFRYLPGLRDTIKKSKMAAKVQKSKTPYITIFSYKASCFMHRGVFPLFPCYLPLSCNPPSYYLRELVLNSRHLGPRRGVNPGPARPGLEHFRGIRGIPGNSGGEFRQA